MAGASKLISRATLLLIHYDRWLAPVHSFGLVYREKGSEQPVTLEPLVMTIDPFDSDSG